jgi:LEA14-like dessication related protein
MNTGLKLWLWLLWLLLLGGCASLSSTTQSPRITLADISVVDIKLLEQRYRIAIRVQNPNDHALEIRGISMELDINGESFASGVGSSRSDIAPYSEGLVELEVTSSLFSVVEQIRALEQRHGGTIDYRIHGRLKLEGSLLGIPFEHRGRFGSATTPADQTRPRST